MKTAVNSSKLCSSNISYLDHSSKIYQVKLLRCTVMPLYMITVLSPVSVSGTQGHHFNNSSAPMVGDLTLNCITNQKNQIPT